MGESKRRHAAGRDRRQGGGRTASAGGEAAGARRRYRAPRLTKRTIAWFLGGCLMLDILLWAVFHFGFARCYGILCLI